MTTYNSPAMSLPARTDLGVNVVTVTFPVTALALNDLINIAKIPLGATIYDLSVNFDDLDSGTALLFAVGDAALATRFIASANQGQAGGFARLSANGFQYYEAADTLIIKCTAAPTGVVAGNIKVTLQYHMHGF